MAQTIIEKVIDQAVRNLRSAGCQFAVITPDGRKLGELTVDQPKKKRGAHRRVNDFTATGYITKVRGMNVGDVLVFEAGAFNPEAYRKTIIAAALTAFGKGNATSSIQGDKIELLRLA